MSALEPNDRPAQRPRIALVFGGRSSEHSVSCVTAASVLGAIDPERYEVVPIGITPTGRWVAEAEDLSHLNMGGEQAPEVDESRPTVGLVTTRSGSSLVGVPPQSEEETGLRISVDAVFPLLHGPFGEDGTVQGMLEMADLRYVGSGVLSSAVGMDKHYMKVVLEAAGIPSLAYAVITARQWSDHRDEARERVFALGYPVFVKPCRGGSSIGITKVKDPDGLDSAVAEAQRWDPKVIVEAFAGQGARELECGVLDTPGGPQASVVAEIVVAEGHDFYDFDAKYLPGQSTRLDVPANLHDNLAEQARALSIATFEALSCESLARVDFFLTTDGQLVVNEANTMPGFTPTSMYPQLWAASGVSYSDLICTLIDGALARTTGLR